MLTRYLSNVAAAALALPLVAALGAPPAAAQTLNGQVTSPEEGRMEGVVVSAKREGTIITVSVVTDADGRFIFPTGRLAPGEYALGARAAGYDLDGPKTVTITVGKNATADLKLRKTRNISRQLTNTEWM